MNAMITRKLKMVEPNAILSIMTAWKNSHPSKSDMKRMPHRIANANTAAPT
jgi:hypothetical protein